MMTKPPGFASSSTLPLEDEEESIDESLDEILLEANERPSEHSVKSLEAVPSSLEAVEDDEDSDPVPTRAGGDVTVLAPRPTFFDEEVREEETKVDPYETAVRAAASRDNGLTTQASQQRDRALRKSTSAPRLPTVRAAAAVADVEFEDPEAGNNAVHGGASANEDLSARTPADIPISAEDDSSPAAGYLAGGASGGFQSRLPPPMRSAPPPGRPDIYPGRRIPTPSSDFLQASTGGFGSGSHYPSIAIPAPSAHDSSARTAAVLAGDNRVRVPAAGLAGFLVVAFGGGLLFGAILWRGHSSEPPMPLPVATHVAPKMITEPVQPIVKPVPPPAPAPQITPTPVPAMAAAPAAAPSMPTLAAETPPAPAVVDPPTTKVATKRSGSSTGSSSAPGASPTSRPAKKTGMSDDDTALNGDEAPPPPPPRPTRSKKKVVWQDPFAQ